MAEPCRREHRPSLSDEDWSAEGWAMESVPLTAANRLGAVIAIELDPDAADLVRQAARTAGLTRAEFARRAVLAAAREAAHHQTPPPAGPIAPARFDASAGTEPATDESGALTITGGRNNGRRRHGAGARAAG